MNRSFFGIAALYGSLALFLSAVPVSGAEEGFSKDTVSPPLRVAIGLSQGQNRFKRDCELAGGTYRMSPGLGKCCWADWGCLRCSARGQCTMQCETARCKKANNQMLDPSVTDDDTGPDKPAMLPLKQKAKITEPKPASTFITPSGKHFRRKENNDGLLRKKLLKGIK